MSFPGEKQETAAEINCTWCIKYVHKLWKWKCAIDLSLLLQIQHENYFWENFLLEKTSTPWVYARCTAILFHFLFLSFSVFKVKSLIADCCEWENFHASENSQQTRKTEEWKFFSTDEGKAEKKTNDLWRWKMKITHT